MSWHKTANNTFKDAKKSLEKYKINTRFRLSTVFIKLILKHSKTIRDMHIKLTLIMIKYVA